MLVWCGMCVVLSTVCGFWCGRCGIVCGMYVCAHICGSCAHGSAGESADGHFKSEKDVSVLLFHSLPYSLKSGSSTSPSHPPVSVPHVR